MVEPIIRMKDIAWIRLRSPDLDLAEQFLRDFGLLTQSTAKALYMHGAGAVHHVQIAEKCDPKVERIACPVSSTVPGTNGFSVCFPSPAPVPRGSPGDRVGQGSHKISLNFHDTVRRITQHPPVYFAMSLYGQEEHHGLSFANSWR
jgi:hypothetical protein